MNPPWWGIPVVLVIGAVVIALGWWLDRRRHRAASAGFTTEEDLAAHPDPVTLPDADVATLLGARTDGARWPAGLADEAFRTHPARGVAAVRRPLVLVTDAEVDDPRLVLNLLGEAREQDRPLVLVAPGFSFDLLGTLHANARTGRVSTVPLELADPDLLAEVAAATGGQVVTGSALQAGWVPPHAWGEADWWVADADDSWAPPPPG